MCIALAIQVVVPAGVVVQEALTIIIMRIIISTAV